MPPKGGNAKKEGGRAKKAENEAKKQEAANADKDRKEAAAWDDGSKGKSKSQQEKEEKKKADAARKAENARLLAEEEAAPPPKVKVAPKAGGKGGAAKASAKAKAEEKPAGPGAIAAGGLGEADDKNPEEVQSFVATGIDNALDLLEVVNAKMDKASIGTQAAGLEKHPERRYKAAFAAYSDQELPNLKQSHPGLRLNQYKELLHKQFEKSPDNPFNQVTVAYDAKKDEKIDALNARKAEVEERLRDRS